MLTIWHTGGTAGGVKLWVEITYKDKIDKTKTVYFSEAKIATFQWNGKMKILRFEVETEIYHDRGLACQSRLMKSCDNSCLRRYARKSYSGNTELSNGYSIKGRLEISG